MDKDSSRNCGSLSLAERACLGLLEPALSVADIAMLEHPHDAMARKAFMAAIKSAIDYRNLPVTPKEKLIPARLQRRDFLRLPPIETPARIEKINLVERESYRIWRAAQCPKRLLSDLSQIHLWLGLSSIPLLEIEQRGLLALTDELSVEDIIWLEAGENSTLGKEWESKIWTAIHKKEEHSKDYLPAWVMPVGDALPGIHFVHRDNYRIWRTSEPKPPADSKIHLWLGAMPAVETFPPTEKSLPETPATTARLEPVGKPKKPQRLDALGNAIQLAIAVLSPGGVLPRPLILLDYLLQNSGKDKKFPDLSPHGRLLLWTNDSEEEKETDIRAITERLRRLKS